MAFETLTPLISYPADGVITEFAIPDKFYDASDVKLFYVDALGLESAFDVGADYSIVITATDPTPPARKSGKAVFSTPPTDGGFVIVFIWPDVDQDQPFEGRPVTPRQNERAHDRHAMRDAALRELLFRGFRAPLNAAPALRYIEVGAPGLVPVYAADGSGSLVEGPSAETLLNAVSTLDAAAALIATYAAQLAALPSMGYTSADRYKTIFNTDTQALQALAAALPDGGAFYVTRTMTINAQVVFPQNRLSVVFVGDAYFRQASGTQSLDNMVTFSGADGLIQNLGIDGNAFGTLAAPTANGNPNYTGRGEVCIISGSGWFIDGVRITGSAPDRAGVPGLTSNLASGLVILGDKCTVHDLHSKNTGLQAVRNRGDNNAFDGLLMEDFASKAFVDDGFASSRAGTISVRNFKLISASTTAAGSILFDSDQRMLARVLVENGYIDLPNIVASGAATKFVYVNDVTMRNVKIKHGTQSTISVRIQQALFNMLVDACEFDARISFDPTVDIDLTISGKSKLGMGSPGINLIQDFRGRLRIDDGCTLANWTTFAVSICPVSEYPAWVAGTPYAVGDKCSNGGNVYICTVAGTSAGAGGPAGLSSAVTDNSVTWAFFSRFDDIKISFGSLLLLPPAGNTTAKLVNTNGFGNLPAGSIQVAAPLRQTGGVLASSGSAWVTNSTSDEIVVQMNTSPVCREFATRAVDSPPSTHDGWLVGDIDRVKNAAAAAAYAHQCITAGSGSNTAWAAATPYAARARVYNGANVYECTVAGTSAGAGGPTGTGAAIADGADTLVWKYVAPRAVWKSMGSLAA